MAVFQHDVLIIGAGLAGMRAGLAAQENGADVAIITKVHPVRSHSNAAQGGINAAVDEDDTWEDHAFDTVKGSDYLGDQDAIEVLCSEAGPEVLALERMGVIFHRGEDGKLGSRAFGGQQRARTYFVGDITGQALLHVLYEQLVKAGLRVYEEWFVLELIVEDGMCKGAVVMEIRTGQLHVIAAKSVIVATGGAGRVYEPSTNALICTGDGISICYRAGAPMMDMEMVQFHPTTLKGSGVLITEGARGEGAYLLNAAGERFMEKYAPNMMELASRDVVSRAEQTEINEGRGVDGCVFLDLRHLGMDLIRERLWQIREIGIDFAGIDMVTDPIPILPGMHYIMGGIKTDVKGATPVPGLYAAGETACVSVHGANRLGANSLLDTVIFGKISGADAAQRARGMTMRLPDESYATNAGKKLQAVLDRQVNGERIAHIRQDLGRSMNTKVQVFRKEDELKSALDDVKALQKRYDTVGVENKGKVFNTDLLFHIELGFMLECAEMICVSSIERKESRGAHYRVDYPARDDENWLHHITCTMGANGPVLGKVACDDHALAAPGKEVLMEVKLRVKRFDPEGLGTEGYQDYTVDMPDNATVLDSLIEVREYQDGTLSLRCSCRSAICGSCAMRINGRARLACKTQVASVMNEAEFITVEPAGNMPPIKDLVVDMAPFWDKIRAVKPWLQPSGPVPEREYIVPNESMAALGETMNCIMCGACVSDCTVLEVDKSFLGPAALAKAWRFVGDPRDAQEMARLREYSEPSGMWDCTRCNMCVQVCPKDVKPMDQIMRLRGQAVHDGIKNNYGSRHTEAFVDLVEINGRLDEFRLPVFTHGKFNFIGQMSDIPVGLRMIKSGKMPNPLPHKIGGVKHVKRIMKRFEHLTPKQSAIEVGGH